MTEQNNSRQSVPDTAPVGKHAPAGKHTPGAAGRHTPGAAGRHTPGAAGRHAPGAAKRLPTADRPVSEKQPAPEKKRERRKLKLPRWLAFFRKTPARAVIFDTAVIGVVICLILCVYLDRKPDMDAEKAAGLAARGQAEAAMVIVDRLERDGYPADVLAQIRVNAADTLFDMGENDRAISMVMDMPEGAERLRLERRGDYARADELFREGDYTGAAQRFYQMSDFEDAMLRYGQCRCALAVQAWQAGDEAAARSLMLGVTDLVDCVNAAALAVTGSEAAAAQVLSDPMFDPEALARMEHNMTQLAEARVDMPQGRIAAGFSHSVGLKADGTVVAAGDNGEKQCEVLGWTNITQVAAGGYHTVGLKADGTVVATGNNTKKQCEVAEWTDIVAIAAGTADTIGLKADGTVVVTGMHAKKAQGWRDATFVTAGSYAMGCICENGTMLASHKAAQMDMSMVLYDLSVCGQVSVGVLYDGQMVSSFDGAPDWDNVVSAVACESGILAIDVDGRVRAFAYIGGDIGTLDVPGVAVEVVSSGSHHLVLTEDGRVHAFGKNASGQCNVSAWSLAG